MPVVVCETCGREKSVKESESKRTTHHFCNRVCYGKWRSKNQQGKNNPVFKDKISRTCLQCNSDFEVSPSALIYRSARFCSNKCYNAWKKAQVPNHRIQKTCPVCGNEFKVRKWIYKEGKIYTCSKRCEYILKSQTRLKENNPNWKNGSSQEHYCPKFNRPFREGVRAVWNYKCAACEKKQEDNLIVKNGNLLVAKLSVHHVHYKKDACCNGESKDWMFAPLCHECHGKSNGARDEWQEKLAKIVSEERNGKSYLTETEYKNFFAQKTLNPALTVSEFLQKSAYAG